MKKVSTPTKKPQTALNLAFLRVQLGNGVRPLSQANMSDAVGASGQGSYKEYEAYTPTPQKIRDRLHDAGINLNWFDTGEGNMLRPGVDRIQLARDENGKVTGLRSISTQSPVNIDRNAAPQNTAGISDDNYIAAYIMVHKACVAADAPQEFMSPAALGRLIVLAARKVAAGEGAWAMAEIEAEVKDFVEAMSKAAR